MDCRGMLHWAYHPEDPHATVWETLMITTEEVADAGPRGLIFP